MEDKPIISQESPILFINAEQEFNQLSTQEKNYSYHFYQAAWEGSKICFFQNSYESPAIFILLQLAYSGQSIAQLKESCTKAGLSESEIKAIIVYSASVFNNCGNYQNFGHKKFVPDVDSDKFFTFLQQSQNYKSHKELMDKIWNEVKFHMFAFKPPYDKLGFPKTQGQSGYYSYNTTTEDIEVVDELLQILNTERLNTRIIKLEENNLLVLIAGVNQSSTVYHYRENQITIQYGDYSAILYRVAEELKQAGQYSANKIEKLMFEQYVKHFQTGDMEMHKESQKTWVKDTGPIVETNIGFIEVYEDPKQVRSEWEGFVAVVDKKKSERIAKFVAQAPELLPLLPWPKEFEKDKFLKPDFTSLSIIGFASSGTPLGINIPNYDDVRQELGFKNVYLGNCLPKLKETQFLNPEDSKHLIKWQEQILNIKVMFHELMGHGCGKLFQKTKDGFNFDIQNVINPLTQKKIESYYKETDTWHSIFQSLSQSYEECRADSVALYLSCFQQNYKELLPEFINQWEDICYGAYIEFIYQGIQGLKYYDEKAQKWLQAHINGRFVILQVLLEAGNDFIKVDISKTQDGKDTINIQIDRKQILTTGLQAMSKFLLKMQVYKSTADIQSARNMFMGYSKVDNKFLAIRKIVIEQQKPRRVELQGHLYKNEKGEIIYQKFEESFDGIVESYMKRYPYFDQSMYELWLKYQQQMKMTIEQL